MITKYYKVSDVDKRNVWSHDFRGRVSIKVLAELVPPEGRFANNNWSSFVCRYLLSFSHIFGVCIWFSSFISSSFIFVIETYSNMTLS